MEFTAFKNADFLGLHDPAGSTVSFQRVIIKRDTGGFSSLAIQYMNGFKSVEGLIDIEYNATIGGYGIQDSFKNRAANLYRIL